MAMFGIDSLETIISQYDPITIQTEFCVRERAGVASCNECVKLCPRLAISFTPELNIDFNQCDGCSVCVALCPTGVFSLKGVTDVGLIKKTRDVLTETPDVSFHCVMASATPPKSKSIFGDVFTKSPEEEVEPEPEGEVAEATEVIVAAEDDAVAPVCAPSPLTHPGAIQVPCLGRLADAVLVAAVANGAESVWLDTRPCSACWRRNGYTIAKHSAKSAETILGAFGKEGRIVFGAEAPFDLPEPPEVEQDDEVEAQIEVAVPEEKEDGVSRRAFFGGLKDNAVKTGAVLIDNKMEELKQLTEMEKTEVAKLDRRLPVRHALLVRFIHSLGTPVLDSVDSADVPFGQLSVDSSCTFCGACESFCPTEAIAVVDLPQNKVVGSLPALCVDCRLCADICPPQAITFNDRIDIPAIVEGKIERLLVGKMLKCTECKQEFFAVGEQKLCTFCVMRREKHGDVSWSQ